MIYFENRVWPRRLQMMWMSMGSRLRHMVRVQGIYLYIMDL